MVLTVDDFLLSLGKPGRYQIISCLLLWSNTYPIAFNNFVMVFYGIIPKHHCKLSDDSNSTNLIPFNDSSQSCSILTDPLNETLGRTPCTDGWDYDPEYKHRSIVSEWDLVCDSKWQLSLGISIYFVGVMIGGLFGGFLADKIGRQPIVLSGIYLQVILGVSVTFVQSYVAFFFQACSFTLMMEMLQPKMRDKAGVLSSFGWVSGVGTIAAIAWAFDDWHHTQLAMTLPSIVSFFYFWFIPESMRWLITQQKVDRAEALARKIAKFNKIELSADVRAQIKQLCLDCAERAQSNPNKNYTLLDLVRTPQIRKYTLICSFVWFTASVVTYGITFGLSSIGSNVYLSIIIGNAVEVALCGVSFILLRKFGRKRPVIVTMSLSGIFCIIVPIILYFGGDSKASTTASTAAAVIGKIIMAFTWAIISVYTIELYPTVIRSFGQGCVTFFTRIGGIISPQIVLLGNVLWKPAPFLICGACGIIAALLILLLPDTHHQPMPDMIEDVENRDKIILKEKKSNKKIKEENIQVNNINHQNNEGYQNPGFVNSEKDDNLQSKL